MSRPGDRARTPHHDEEPRGFSDWLHVLQSSDVGLGFDVELARLLRVLAGAKAPAVALAVGAEAVPYSNWLQDGMSMDGRLILHASSGQDMELVRPHFSTDIRVALHEQDLAEFLADIEEHRFDFILAGLDDIEPGTLRVLLDRLAEHGLLAGFGTGPALHGLIEACRDAWFLSRGGGGMLACRKGLQHRAVRRGGRRRHTQID